MYSFQILILAGIQFSLTPLSISDGQHLGHMAHSDMYDDTDERDDDIREDVEVQDESRDSESPISDVEIAS